MTKSGLASVDVIKFLEVRPRSSDMVQFYSCIYQDRLQLRFNGGVFWER